MRAVALAIVTAIVMVAVLLVPSASAVTVFPDQKPIVGSPAIDKMLRTADRYWAGRGVTGCAKPTVWSASLLIDTDGVNAVGRGTPTGCQMWLLDRYIRWTGARWFRMTEKYWMCLIVVHERGHTLGLQHSDADKYPAMSDPPGTVALCKTLYKPNRVERKVRPAIRQMLEYHPDVRYGDPLPCVPVLDRWSCPVVYGTDTYEWEVNYEVEGPTVYNAARAVSTGRSAG